MQAITDIKYFKKFKAYWLGLIKETKFYAFQIILKWHITGKKAAQVLWWFGELYYVSTAFQEINEMSLPLRIELEQTHIPNTERQNAPKGLLPANALTNCT